MRCLRLRHELGFPLGVGELDLLSLRLSIASGLLGGLSLCECLCDRLSDYAVELLTGDGDAFLRLSGQGLLLPTRRIRDG